MVQLFDQMTFDKARESSGGFMAVRARAARAGIYDYTGAEVDPSGARFKPNDTVKVYRPADQVFDKASLASFVGKPITNDHPTQAVTAANWRDHARGTVMGATRDGDFVGFDLAFMDAALIADIKAGKRELSNGYSCSLDFTPGTLADGTAYDAIQTGITGNHVAVVDKGRAGPECRVGDASQRFATCDANPAAVSGFTTEPQMKKITLDGGLLLDLADADAVAAAITKFRADTATATNDLATARTDIATRDGTIAALTQQLADAKAELDPATLDKRVADRATLIADAIKLAPTLDATGKSDADIRRAAVAAKLGDATPTDDAAVSGAFVALLASDAPASNIVPLSGKQTVDDRAVRDTIRSLQFA